jgi:hypothetical protein
LTPTNIASEERRAPDVGTARSAQEFDTTKKRKAIHARRLAMTRSINPENAIRLGRFWWRSMQSA